MSAAVRLFPQLVQIVSERGGDPQFGQRSTCPWVDGSGGITIPQTLHQSDVSDGCPLGHRVLTVTPRGAPCDGSAGYAWIACPGS